MPTQTYIPLANVTLGSSASTVSFANIPNSYRDLVCVVNHTKSTLTGFYIRYNGDAGANYAGIYIVGGGTYQTAGSSTEPGYSSTLSTQILQVMDYSATDKHKTSLLRTDNSGNQTTAWSLRWANTAAITSLSFVTVTGTFQTGSTFSLYGINA
jgi:hypothetical protein